MTINREKLIKLLVEKTNLKESEVETQLDELTQRILDAASRGKALEIKDFGLFYFDENGQLCFKASDQFDTEINYQFTGMEPVELKPANKFQTSAEKQDQPEEKEPEKRDEKVEPVTVNKDKDDVFGIGRTLAGKTEGQDLDNEESDEQEPDPLEKLIQKPTDEIKPKPEEKIHKAGTAPKKVTSAKEKSSGRVKKMSRNPMTMIIVIILGFVVLSVGYLLLSEYLDAPEPTVTESTEPVPLEEPPATAEPDITETEEPVEQEEVGVGEEIVADDTQTDTEESGITPEEERYGLYGDYVEAPGDEFTIVVHSLPNRSLAEQTADELRQEGFRTSVMERVVNDRVVFRVGIGQFESVQSALSESEAIPEPYRNQNFIHRIQ